MIQIEFGKTEIVLHYSFFLVLFLFIILDKAGFATGFLIASIVHELGHLIAMKSYQVRVQSISLSLLGIHIKSREEKIIGVSSEVMILMAGAFINSIFAAIFGFVPCQFFMKLSACNLLLAVFQLMPLNGLDGGSILRIWSSQIFGLQKGYIIAKVVSFLFCGFIVAMAILYMNFGNGQRIPLVLIVFAIVAMLSSCLE